jgi:outer membrane receptor for ferrienterochelin and colicins
MKQTATLFLLLIGFPPLWLSAQTASLHGQITHEGQPLAAVNVALLNTAFGTISDQDGQYHLADLPAGEYTLQVSYLGYRSERWPVQLSAGEEKVQNAELKADVLRLEDIVVTGTRNAVPAHRAPVMVNRIDSRVFERTQSISLSEGLSFSPGLRLENNCQNCGFTQLRMNGLDGPYTQVLVNSRPVFSALAGVYGLELIPANMVDRVEVVRGGGSALYGGNAIAGTVNIITKEPTSNSFELGSNLAFINQEAPDRTLSVNGSIVDEQLKKGMSFYAFNRSRAEWDANQDGFSEITRLRNTTFGFDAFYNPDAYSKIKLNVFSINEFRRGGDNMDLPPHQTEITEQLEHQILGGGLSYERFSKDKRHKLAVYTSATTVDRSSYYGGGGRVLGEGDALTESDLLALNAYGQSDDLSLAAGLQYHSELNEQWALTAGGEYQYNEVLDEMPGYGRFIEQTAATLGTYAQLEWKPSAPWSFLFGGRYDYVDVEGLYALAGEDFSNEQQLQVFVPRATALYFFNPDLKFRFSYAQGYRAPQVFDEDLHIETVGGAALFTRLDPELQAERSNSFNASLDYTLRKDRFEANFVVDGFYTNLSNPFINSDQQELPSGVAVITKRNGSGATVTGLNLEANFAFSKQWMVQMGGTLQSARYAEAEELWSPETLTDSNQDSVTTARNLLRTPNVYGYLSATWSPTERLGFSVSSIYTGAMEVPHVIDADSEYTVIKRTPDFLVLNVKLSYAFPLGEQSKVECFAGLQNILNSYQSDFDRGPERDAGYVYGPNQPRTAFLGLTFRM